MPLRSPSDPSLTSAVPRVAGICLEGAPWVDTTSKKARCLRASGERIYWPHERPIMRLGRTSALQLLAFTVWQLASVWRLTDVPVTLNAAQI